MVFTQPRLTFSSIPTTALAYGTLNQRLFSPTAAAAATIKGAAASVCSSNGNAIIQRWGWHRHSCSNAYRVHPAVQKTTCV